MMAKSISYHPKVPSEARDLLAYYQRVSTGLADDFWSELLEAIEYACAYPERHHFDRLGLRRSNLTRFPVNFLFRVFPESIRITVVRHDSRDPAYGAGRR